MGCLLWSSRFLSRKNPRLFDPTLPHPNRIFSLPPCCRPLADATSDVRSKVGKACRDKTTATGVVSNGTWSTPRSAIPLATPIMKGIPNYSPVGKGLFRVCSSSVCWNNLRTWGFWCHPPKKLTWQAGLNPQLEDVYIYIWECWSIYIEHGTKQKMSCFSFLGWFITWWFMAVGN